MSGSTPERTLEQRRNALKRANDIRMKRARFKRDVKAGRVDKLTVRSYIREPPDWLETMKIFDLLFTIPKYGKTKVNQTLRGARVSPAKTLGGLSPRQRNDLVSYLR